MPIYKLNPQLSSGAFTGKNDRRHNEHPQTFWELHESDRYRRAHQGWNEDACKQYIKSHRRKKDVAAECGGMMESFIEREIREQRRRELELLDDHKHSANSLSDKLRSPQTVTRHAAPPAEQRRRRARSHDGRYDDRRGNDDEELRYSHLGASLIVRELLEQQKREKELRRYRREMGLELNNDNSDDNSDNDNNNDSVQQRHNDDDDDDKVQVVDHEQRQKFGRNSATLDSTKHSANSFTEYEKQADDEDMYSRSTSHKDDVEADESKLYVPSLTAASAHPARSSVHVMEKTSEQKMTLRLNSNSDDVDDDLTRTPLFEVPGKRRLDCEVKRSRDGHGLAAVTYDDTRRSVAVQTDAVNSHQTVPDLLNIQGAAERRRHDHRTLTKRSAENRPRTERQRDRQRQFDLRSTDIIRSTSPDRRQMPLVLCKYAYPYCECLNRVTAADTPTTSTRLSPEARIEQEVADFRRRENELRRLREMTRHEHMMTSHDANLYPGNRHHAPAALEPKVTSHGGRRRLALIEQCEKTAETSAEPSHVHLSRDLYCVRL